MDHSLIPVDMKAIAVSNTDSGDYFKHADIQNSTQINETNVYNGGGNNQYEAG